MSSSQKISIALVKRHKAAFIRNCTIAAIISLWAVYNGFAHVSQLTVQHVVWSIIGGVGTSVFFAFYFTHAYFAVKEAVKDIQDGMKAAKDEEMLNQLKEQVKEEHEENSDCD